MNKQYVEEYVELEKHHWWFIVRQKILISLLRKHLGQKSLKILNVGAAAGASSRWLAAFGEVTSLESDPLFTHHLQKQNLKVINASVTQMPFSAESFDLVCAFDVIEHVQDHLLAIQEALRVCKTGGFICLTVPAFQSLWSRHDVVNGHFRRYTKSTLLSLLKSVPALKKLELTYFNSILFVPILFARTYSNVFGSKSQQATSDFTGFKTGKIFNEILKSIFSLEVKLLNRITFPVGVSLFGIWKKEELRNTTTTE